VAQWYSVERIGRTTIRKLGAHEALTRLIFDNLIFEMATAQILGTSYLSELELPLQLPTAISGDPDVARRNPLVQKHLTSMVPFFAEISPRVALRLRRREEDAFVAYRKVLNTAIDNVRSEGSSFRERDARVASPPCK
jgi:hypothetical protein